MVLDPFAGGSVRGIVAAQLGRPYIGIELRPEQIEANRADALEWMRTADIFRGAVVTSLPDPEEIGQAPEQWRDWFVEAAGLAMSITDSAAPAIFYQTDRKADGQAHSKAGLLLEAATARGMRLLWHKIVLRRRPGAIDLHRWLSAGPASWALRRRTSSSAVI